MVTDLNLFIGRGCCRRVLRSASEASVAMRRGKPSLKAALFMPPSGEYFAEVGRSKSLAMPINRHGRSIDQTHFWGPRQRQGRWVRADPNLLKSAQCSSR
jgi:hypothetical protein